MHANRPSVAGACCELAAGLVYERAALAKVGRLDVAALRAAGSLPRIALLLSTALSRYESHAGVARPACFAIGLLVQLLVAAGHAESARAEGSASARAAAAPARGSSARPAALLLSPAELAEVEGQLQRAMAAAPRSDETLQRFGSRAIAEFSRLAAAARDQRSGKSRVRQALALS